MSGIVGSRFNIRGSGLVGSLGTDGQVFTSSGAGAGAAFEAAGDNTPSFLAQVHANQAIANATQTVGAYATEHWDTDSAWDTSTYKFTVPAGKGGGYHFTVVGYITNIDDGENFRMSLAKNGTILTTSETKWFSSATNQEIMVGRSWNVPLVATDYVQVFVYHTEGASQDLDYRFSTFSGFKIAGV